MTIILPLVTPASILHLPLPRILQDDSSSITSASQTVNDPASPPTIQPHATPELDPPPLPPPSSISEGDTNISAPPPHRSHRHRYTSYSRHFAHLLAISVQMSDAFALDADN